MKLFFIFIVLVARAAFAADVTVEMRKHDRPPVVREGFEYLPQNVKPIDAEKRDLFFKSQGLLQETGKMDEVEKNVLFLRLKKVPLARLTHLYPDISKDSLKKAKKSLEEK